MYWPLMAFYVLLSIRPPADREFLVVFQIPSFRLPACSLTNWLSITMPAVLNSLYMRVSCTTLIQLVIFRECFPSEAKRCTCIHIMISISAVHLRSTIHHSALLPIPFVLAAASTQLANFIFHLGTEVIVQSEQRIQEFHGSEVSDYVYIHVIIDCRSKVGSVSKSVYLGGGRGEGH